MLLNLIKLELIVLGLQNVINFLINMITFYIYTFIFSITHKVLYIGTYYRYVIGGRSLPIYNYYL